MPPVASNPGERRIFSLDDAQQLLPTIRQLTAEAVRRSDALAEKLQVLPEDHPEYDRLNSKLNDVVMRWAAEIRALDVEVKGLWLVDFDNGEGYYCWRYPEESVAYYHTYDEGFAGRIKIT
jgi:hypothetical protein